MPTRHTPTGPFHTMPDTTEAEALDDFQTAIRPFRREFGAYDEKATATIAGDLPTPVLTVAASLIHRAYAAGIDAGREDARTEAIMPVPSRVAELDTELRIAAGKLDQLPVEIARLNRAARRVRLAVDGADPDTIRGIAADTAAACEASALVLGSLSAHVRDRQR
jgi:hypothetical protein